MTFLGAFRDPDMMCIVMERCSGGDLLEQLLKDGHAMSESRVAKQVRCAAARQAGGGPGTAGALLTVVTATRGCSATWM